MLIVQAMLYKMTNDIVAYVTMLRDTYFVFSYTTSPFHVV
jgi:hypothetical protein